MNLEVNRLRTFGTWPSNAPVDPRVLARCGFFGTGNFLEAECNWCHHCIRDWEYGDQVDDRHRLLEPLCNFLANYETCGNVPISVDSGLDLSAASNVPVSASPQHSVNLLIEANRLATFKNWPNPNITPESLAKAGFFYLNRSDEVKCAWCKGVIAKWEKQDNAFDEHRRFFPDCPRVQLGPLIEMASEGIRDLGIQQVSPPKEPKYSSLDARLNTYTNWPISNVQRPEALSQAGLYYQNIGDQVRCFHCNIGLRSWQKEDDPWFEHAKWYPECQFVRLVKGANYVQQVRDIFRHSAQQPTGPTCPSMSIEEAMNTPAVLQALEIGIDGGSIRNVTQRQLLENGRPYDTVEDLVKAVFGDREDGTYEVENSDSSIVREVSRIITSILNTSDGGERFGSPPLVTSNTDNSAAPAPIVPTANIKNAPNSQSEPLSGTAERVPTESLVTRDISPNRSLALEEENRKLKDARLCKVCLDEEVGVVFLPCGHLVTCVQCAPGIEQCPMCRTAIKGFVRTYLS